MIPITKRGCLEIQELITLTGSDFTAMGTFEWPPGFRRSGDLGGIEGAEPGLEVLLPWAENLCLWLNGF
jgi:hypothetical protein